MFFGVRLWANEVTVSPKIMHANVHRIRDKLPPQVLLVVPSAGS